MHSALVYILFNCTGYVLALFRGPFWALLVLANIYFNAPVTRINWWAGYLPFHSWSMVTALFALASLLIHHKDLAPNLLGSLKWAFALLALSATLSMTVAVEPKDALHHTYMLSTFLVVAYCLLRGLKDINQYRFLLLWIILLATNLALKAHLYGRRYHARLEGIGPADAFGSNEFGLLLAAIIPLTFPFVLHGRKYEKVFCIFAIPILFNGLVLCNSRGTFVALAGAVIITLFIMWDKRIRKILFIGILATIPMFICLADEAFLERISTLIAITDEQKQNSSEELENLSSGRTTIWGYSFQMLKDHPFGAGPNGYRHLARYYLPPEMLDYSDLRIPEGTRSAHNSHLQLLIELGYIGFILWLLFCGHTLLLTTKRFFALRRSPANDLFLQDNLVMLNVSFLSILLGGLFNSRIYYEFFWWQVALCMTCASLAKNAISCEYTPN